jgi:hypothetical protein
MSSDHRSLETSGPDGDCHQPCKARTDDGIGQWGSSPFNAPHCARRRPWQARPWSWPDPPGGPTAGRWHRWRRPPPGGKTAKFMGVFPSAPRLRLLCVRLKHSRSGRGNLNTEDLPARDRSGRTASMRFAGSIIPSEIVPCDVCQHAGRPRPGGGTNVRIDKNARLPTQEIIAYCFN